MNSAAQLGTSAAYGLELKSRCIAALHTTGNDPAAHRFVVGTASLRAMNKIHLLEYHDTMNVVECTAVWTHESEILGLSTLPSQTQALFATVHASPAGKEGSTCTIFELASGPEAELKVLQRLPMSISALLWDPQGVPTTATALTENAVITLKIDDPKAPVASLALPSVQRVFGGCWDPHHHDVVAVAADAHIFCADFRAKRAFAICENAHGLSTRCIDYNPNKVYTIVSVGDDGLLKFWDLRKGSEPVIAFATVQAHEHWTHHVSYNPSNDHLLLTASSDNSVKLWQFFDHSSYADSQSKSPSVADFVPDGCVKSGTEYGDSVFSACWSATSSWVYAACAYNGKVLVEHVPENVQRQSRMRTA